MTQQQQTHTVKAVFTFKDNACKNEFVSWCTGVNGLGVTRSWKGNQSIECYESHENPNQITLWQKWDNQKAHASYVQHRHEDGTFDLFGPLFASPPVINALKPVEFQTDRDQIEAIVKDMCNVDYTLGSRHMHEKCVFVRPSGNPLNMTQWVEMMNDKDVTVESNDLVKFNRVEVVGDMAYVCYTTHGVFNYKGTANDDVAVLTSVLQRIDGRWQVVFGQRSTGRSPMDQDPVFAEA